jgi:hypothetical protein
MKKQIALLLVLALIQTVFAKAQKSGNVFADDQKFVVVEVLAGTW